MIRKNLSYDELSVIAMYMDENIREQVHFELAPCTPYEFLNRYCELDENFIDTLNSEFHFVMEDK